MKTWTTYRPDVTGVRRQAVHIPPVQPSTVPQNGGSKDMWPVHRMGYRKEAAALQTDVVERLEGNLQKC